MATTVEDVCNEALDVIGYPRHIGSVYDGTVAARVALDLYGQTRDALLQHRDWAFARREATLAASGSTPPSPWANAYTYPTDCLLPLQVRPGPLAGTTRTLDPAPILWDVRDVAGVRIIVASQASAVLVYRVRVIDPANWTPEYTDLLVAELAKRFAPRLRAVVQPERQQNNAREQS